MHVVKAVGKKALILPGRMQIGTMLVEKNLTISNKTAYVFMF